MQQVFVDYKDRNQICTGNISQLNKIDDENLKFAGPLLAKSRQCLKSRFKSIIELDVSRKCVVAKLDARTNPDIKLQWITIRSSTDAIDFRRKVLQFLADEMNSLFQWITIRSSTDARDFRRKVLQFLADEMNSLKTCKQETEARPVNGISDPFLELKTNRNLEKSLTDDVDLEVLNFLKDNSCDLSSLNLYPKIRKVL